MKRMMISALAVAAALAAGSAVAQQPAAPTAAEADAFVANAEKQLADRKKNIYDEDLTALVADDVFDMPLRYQLQSVEFRSGTSTQPWARVTVTWDGQDHTAEAEGNGPVNAVIEALKLCTNNCPMVGKRSFKVGQVSQSSPLVSAQAIQLSSW